LKHNLILRINICHIMSVNIYGLYVYSQDKKLIQQYCPSNIYSIDSIVQNIQLQQTNYSAFEHDTRIFYLLIKYDKIVIAVTNHIYPRRVVVRLLEEIDIWLLSKKSINLSKFYLKYNDFEKIDQLALTQGKVNQVKDLMHENINKILENQIKLESIEDQTADLMQSAGIFADTAKKLKNKMWWRNIRLKLYIGLVVLLILGLIVGIVFGTMNNNSK